MGLQLLASCVDKDCYSFYNLKSRCIVSKSNKDFFKKKKEWSKTKDEILGSYLVPYFSKLLTKNVPICYVDCFAGKGVFDSGEIGSPLIALHIMEERLKSCKKLKASNIFAYFIEPIYYICLQNNINAVNDSRIVKKVVPGKFEDHIKTILNTHNNQTVFLYIDPYGIKCLDVAFFNGLKSNENQSIELLINFNTWGFFRNACKVLKIDLALEPEIESYLGDDEASGNFEKEDLTRIAGGDYWINIVKNYQISGDAKAAEQELSKRIADKFKEEFKYVLNVPIKSGLNNKTPKYRLYHLSNHSGGCLLMADVMFKRINDSFVRLKSGQTSLFDYSAEGELLDYNDVKKLVLQQLPNANTRITDFVCSFFINNGVITSIKTINDVLKELNRDGVVLIKRYPPNKNGRLTTFMKEGGNQKVVIRRVDK